MRSSPAMTPTMIETPRLRVRPLEERDAAFILELVNDPDWKRFIGDRGLRTLEDARTYLRNGPMAMYARVGFSLDCVVSKETGAPLGICGLIKRDTLEDVDLGFAFLPRGRGQGYAAEASAAVLGHAWELGLRRVVAIVSPGNDRSIALLEKLGFRLEGSRRLQPSDADEVLLFVAQPAEGSEPAEPLRT